jgi:radical SAM-linked protein
MAPEPPTTTPTAVAEPLAVRDKIRIRFRKSGELRLLSHHDLMRAFERMLRRAALPFRNTQGFHPKPRLVFALSLPLGVVGCEEVVELELSEILPLDQLQQRLAAQCPRGLDLLSLRRIDVRATAHVRAFTYRIALPPERLAGVQERIRDLLASKECLLERSRPTTRRVDLRAFIRDLRVTPAPSAFSEPRPLGSGAGLPPLPNGRGSESRGSDWLEMDLWLTPQGTARPEEVLSVLGVKDLLDAGAVLERARLELTDENMSPANNEGIA